MIDKYRNRRRIIYVLLLLLLFEVTAGAAIEATKPTNTNRQQRLHNDIAVSF